MNSALAVSSAKNVRQKDSKSFFCIECLSFLKSLSKLS